MSYKKTNHKNALLKLIKEKRMILQIDAASVMNVLSSTLNSTSKSLEKEGKIKRQKIKVRYSNGNLNDAWLLHILEVKQNEIIDYEKILINKPFESPLKQHHCYKKKESPVTSITVTEPVNTNIIDMQEYITVNNYDLGIKEYKGQRVITFDDIDKTHNRVEGTAKRNFNQHKEKLIKDIDYFEITKKEFSTKFVPNSKQRGNPNLSLYLLTESGYLMVVKSLHDDLAWKVQRQLVNSYFKLKELKENPKINNLPDIKNMQFADILELIAKGMKEQNIRIDNMENKLNSIAKIING